MNTDCIFCKITSKVIPSANVYEDEKFLAFLDIHPVAKGHILLIPKDHFQWMNEAPDEMIANSFILTKKLMDMMKTALACDFVQIGVVGKDVPHFHIHLIPRWLDDKIPSGPTIEYSSDSDMNDYASKIKNTL